MELEILKNEEKRMNMIMFLFLDVIPVVAVTYVLLFNGGSGRDAIALVMVAASLLIKVFEKKLGTYAKYLYISVLPLFGAVTLVVGTPGVFGAMVEAYFLVLFLAVPYYDLSVIKVCAVVTVVVNAVALIIFRQAYLCMYTLSIWACARAASASEAVLGTIFIICFTSTCPRAGRCLPPLRIWKPNWVSSTSEISPSPRL